MSMARRGFLHVLAAAGVAEMLLRHGLEPIVNGTGETA